MAVDLGEAGKSVAGGATGKGWEQTLEAAVTAVSENIYSQHNWNFCVAKIIFKLIPSEVNREGIPFPI